MNPPLTIKIQELSHFDYELNRLFNCPCHSQKVMFDLPFGQVTVSTHLDLKHDVIISAQVIKLATDIIYSQGSQTIQFFHVTQQITGLAATSVMKYETIAKTNALVEKFMTQLNSFADYYNRQWNQPFPCDGHRMENHLFFNLDDSFNKKTETNRILPLPVELNDKIFVN